MQMQFKELEFPISGVDRRRGYQDQPPYTTPWAVNVRPICQTEGRARGGRRPGLKKTVSASLGAAVTALVPLAIVSGETRTDKLAAIAGLSLSVIADGAVSSPAGDLVTEAGVDLTTESGAVLVTGVSLASVCQVDDRSMKLYAADGTVKICDLTTGIVTPLVATAGAVPAGCTLVRTYRDRLVLAGANHTVWVSRQGVPTDWNTGADVENNGRAMVFQASDAGHIGDVVTALITRGDSWLCVACKNSLWTLQGDPSDGQFNAVSRSIGVVGPNAWCTTDSMTMFLARDGLYIWPVGDSPQRFSQEKLPEELLDIDVSANTVTMIYDNAGYGVHVFVTPASGVGKHWWIDLRSKGIWPVLLQEGQQPLSVCRYKGDVWLGCKDGYLRKFNAASDDDGTAITSHVLIGPLWLSGSGAMDGILTELQGVISGSATWRIVAGESAEIAVDKAVQAVELYNAGSSVAGLVSGSGTWGDGRNRIAHPRVRSPWIVLWIQSSALWECESATLGVRRLGRWR